MGLLDLLIGRDDLGTCDPHWVRTPAGHFWRLADVRPDEIGLARLSGVYVIWHGGVQPRWLRAGRAQNLALVLTEARNDAALRAYEDRGGLWVAWSAVRPEFQDGVVSHLIRTLDPLLPDPRASAAPEPIPVLVPGGRARPLDP